MAQSPDKEQRRSSTEISVVRHSDLTGDVSALPHHWRHDTDLPAKSFKSHRRKKTYYFYNYLLAWEICPNLLRSTGSLLEVKLCYNEGHQNLSLVSTLHHSHHSKA